MKFYSSSQIADMNAGLAFSISHWSCSCWHNMDWSLWEHVSCFAERRKPLQLQVLVEQMLTWRGSGLELWRANCWTELAASRPTVGFQRARLKDQTSKNWRNWTGHCRVSSQLLCFGEILHHIRRWPDWLTSESHYRAKIWGSVQLWAADICATLACFY